jgi:ABC-2 type transport system ATP-binding protein
MTPVIEVAGLTKRYGGQPVVDGISLHVDQGEIFGFLGPNGAGKDHRCRVHGGPATA